MTEETKPTETPEATANEKTLPEVKPKENPAVAEAKAVVERMEKANAEAKEILARQESLAAENIVSGQADAGQAPPPKKTDDEKWAEDAKKRYEGTGMDPTPDTEEKK